MDSTMTILVQAKCWLDFHMNHGIGKAECFRDLVIKCQNTFETLSTSTCSQF